MRNKVGHRFRWVTLLLPFVFSPGAANATSTPPYWPFEGVAKPWILALKAGDVVTLESLTALPFTYATTAASKECVMPVRTTADLKTWASCIRRAQATLFAKMDTGSYVNEKTGGWGEPKAFPAMAKDISRDGLWVEGYLLNPRGLDYSFRFLIGGKANPPEQVAALLLAVQPEKQERPTSREPHNRALQRTGLAPRR